MKKFSFVIGLLVLMAVSVFGLSDEDLCKAALKAWNAGEFDVAYQYYQKSAFQNYNGHSFWWLGLYWQYGKGGRIDMDMAFSMYEKGAELEDPDSESYVTPFYVFKRELQDANNGDVDAMYYVAYDYASGYGCQRSLTEAKYWSRKAADRGHKYAIKLYENIINGYYR